MASSLFDAPLPISNFTYSNIQEYVLLINEQHDGHGESSVLKESIKGAKLFQAKFVNDFKFMEPKPGYVMINAKVRAEMKNAEYEVCMTIREENEVLHATCECPGGAPPACCKHTFAVLAFIQDYSCKELYNAPTEKLQEWHQPSKKRKCSPKKTSEMFCASHKKTNMESDGVNFRALKNLQVNAPIFTLLPDSSFDFSSHLIDKTMPLPQVNDETFDYKNELKDVCLPLAEIIFLKEKVIITLKEAQEIEKITTQQSLSKKWHELRQYRITASNFHKVLKRQKDFNELSLQLINHQDISSLPAVKYGKENESVVKELLRQKNKQLTFRNVGLIINPNFPYLGASPDGLFWSEKENFLVEIKSIYNTDNLSLEELCHKRSGFCLEAKKDGFILRKDHPYYTQIQGQLAISGLEKCLFCLSINFKNQLHIEAVPFCPEFWGKCKNVLKDFYFNIHVNNICK